MNETSPQMLAAVVVWGAFALAFLFGAAAAKTNFCTMGAVSDVVNIGDWARMRMWLLAIAIAIAGTSALQLAGQIDISKSIYVAPNFLWMSQIIGGLLFGVGMTLASGCGSKNLVRLGGGNLKSFVVFLVLGVTAYMTMRGVLGVFRVTVLDSVLVRFSTAQDLPSLFASALGTSRPATLAVASVIVVVGLLAFVFASRTFRTFDNILGGVVVGLVIVGGWYLSGHVGYLAEDPNTLEEKFLATNSGRMESLSLIAPQAYLLELLMLWSDRSRVMTFGIAIAIGIVAGSLAYALATRSFRLESFRDADDLLAHIGGAALMGFGGVLALGCTIGQGLSGVSTLSLGSFLVFFCIVTGAAAAMKLMYWRMLKEA